MFGPKHDLELLREYDWEKVSRNDQWKADMLALTYFFDTILHITDQNGWTVTGCSVSQRGLNTLLVVKATHDGIPLVAYCTEKFPTGCVRTFARMYLQDRVKWHPDRFAGT